MAGIRGALCVNVFEKFVESTPTVCFDVSIYHQIGEPDVTNERMTHLLKLDTFFHTPNARIMTHHTYETRIVWTQLKSHLSQRRTHDY